MKTCAVHAFNLSLILVLFDVGNNVDSHVRMSLNCFFLITLKVFEMFEDSGLVN